MLVYQIEVSNRCNLTCAYCPHPTQSRRQGLMSWSTFKNSIELLLRCGQHTAYLHNFGEPLLHPELIGFVRHCTERDVNASFFTNGTLLDGEVLDRLASAGLRTLCVSEHTRGELDRVRSLIAEGGFPIAISDTFRPVRTELHSWADQVSRKRPTRGEVSTPDQLGPCVFERRRAAVVLWDGRVNVCCIDAGGRGTRGHVDDYLLDPDSYEFQPIPLCLSCTLMRGDEDLS